MARIVPVFPIALLAALPGCSNSASEPDDVQRISLAEARHAAETPLPSPETEGAGWVVSENGQAIHFGQPEEPPFLTLSCNLRTEPAQLHIIRHVTGRPGQKALFPIIGNGTISRFKLDAALVDGEWRWEGAVPARDPKLDVFTGSRELEATLPGGGSLAIAGSRIPGEFVNWCRAGGRVQQAQAKEQEEAEGREAE
ncbi:hypothetical protein FHS61_001578 [Altererythrobacter atlanticus]|uniref:Uncharacterized protein n=1 Tax=Croceibacterium atlanticum TaxID=1267766 RepID=A0A0F7KV90_9SPHN|nr:hypothetical protein [Croceibacterium atlanticum]AKH44258.1 hypothetical protein WYH_03239 [Croceibacterium atlanticum]MBB5732569.1 hypothetical protein [Croceibacterium atlanticum]